MYGRWMVGAVWLWVGGWVWGAGIAGRQNSHILYIMEHDHSSTRDGRGNQWVALCKIEHIVCDTLVQWPPAFGETISIHASERGACTFF